MSGKVYPLGYSAPGAASSLDTLMQDEQTILVDIRYSVKSMRKPAWSGSALRERYGKRYLWIQELGNINYYNGGDITLYKPEKGIERLMTGLQKGYTLILLCTCSNYMTCHRKDVVELLQKAVPEVEIIHPDTTAVPEDSIMCLSVRQPYADWLVHPQKFMANGIIPKTIENREWSTNYRGPLLIHASKSFEQDAFQYWLHQCPELGNGNLWDVASPEKKDYVLGAIIGIADLVDVVEDSDDPWFVGSYGWVLKDAHAFDEPIPWKGALKLFPVLVCHCCNMPVKEDEFVMAEQYRLCYRCCK